MIADFESPFIVASSSSRLRVLVLEEDVESRAAHSEIPSLGSSAARRAARCRRGSGRRFGTDAGTVSTSKSSLSSSTARSSPLWLRLRSERGWVQLGAPCQATVVRCDG